MQPGLASFSIITLASKNACRMSAKEKKLAGAAEKSFTTKCVGDKVGS